MAVKKQNRPPIILVLGGARSGKSRYAQQLAERLGRRPLFLATAEALDDEMRQRIRRHRAKRGPRWQCAEEPLDVARVIRTNPAGNDAILLDCVTIWLSNVMLKEGSAAVARRKNELLSVLQAARCPVILVANEVGLGIVPENPLGREFRDQAGWLNQELAGAAQTVVLVVAGLPLAIKGKLP